MSRLIVKNLPKQITEEKLKGIFSANGLVTDCQLKYDKNGRFRQFAFIGYKTEEEAQSAKNLLDKTYVGNSKIIVEICNELGKSTSVKQKKLVKIKNNERSVAPNTQKVVADPFDELKDDEEFSEFLKLQRNVGSGSKEVWNNDTTSNQMEKKSIENSKKTEEQKTKDEKPQDVKKAKFNFTAIIRGLPYKCTKSKIRNFFDPLKPISIRLPPKIKGIAYISFESDQELKQSLVKHRGFLEGHRVEVTRYEDKDKKDETNKKNEKNPIYKTNEPADEDVCESGRIFIRNLCYSCTEEDIEALFSKFGPLSEVSLPVDSFTKKLKGFGFVTFLFPEHAVKAFTELDGTIFQGRVLHLIPAKSKPDKPETPCESSGSSFKNEKDQKKKEEANSSHNWNTLFLGPNAVADLMSEKYGVTKSKLIADKDSKESVAVRMALGETQLVMETKKFLISNGIDVDAFRESPTSRSKTVLLAKNLPMGTKPEELQTLFSKFGLVSRVVLPPFGITAIVEMQEATEAKNAFKKLAYSNFKHYPLYLEWAPSNVFTELNKNTEITEKADESLTNPKLDENDEKPEDDTTIFIKNLNFKTDEEAIRSHFEKCGKVYKVTITRKRHPNGSVLPVGYGFVQFRLKKAALRAMKELQNSVLDDHNLQLKLSHQSTSAQKNFERKRVIENKPGTKILIRNIPFEATVKDVKELFSSFGDLKSVRMPKKLSGVGSHRGFGFADFTTKSGAKKAMESLGESTHLYGRRLALEWAIDESTENDALASQKRDAAKSDSTFVRGKCEAHAS